MSRLRVLADVDGVIADFVTAYLSVVNHCFGRSHVPADVTDWEIQNALGLTPEEIRTVTSYVQSRGFASHLEPYQGSHCAIQRLRAQYDLYFVTSPQHGHRDAHLSWHADREHWLWDHFGVSPDSVLHTSAKHIVAGDVFVDDKPANVRLWQEHNPNGLALLWSQPYNQEDREGLKVCRDWDHLFEILELLERGYWRGAPGEGGSQ